MFSFLQCTNKVTSSSLCGNVRTNLNHTVRRNDFSAGLLALEGKYHYID